MLRVDLTRLIRALETVNSASTYQEQLNYLELLLVEAELNPNPLALDDLTDGLDLLGQFQKREVLAWGDAQAGLEPFFV